MDNYGHAVEYKGLTGTYHSSRWHQRLPLSKDSERKDLNSIYRGKQYPRSKQETRALAPNTLRDFSLTGRSLDRSALRLQTDSHCDC